MHPWMWTGIWWIILFAAGVALGILIKGHKIRPIISIIKDKNLGVTDKAKQLSKIDY